jgi:hypothetical protein
VTPAAMALLMPQMLAKPKGDLAKPLQLRIFGKM